MQQQIKQIATPFAAIIKGKISFELEAFTSNASESGALGCMLGKRDGIPPEVTHTPKVCPVRKAYGVDGNKRQFGPMTSNK